MFDSVILNGTIADGTGKPCYNADIVVFDLEQLGTKASFDNPAVYPAGIEHVFVNGCPVVSAGEFNNEALPGMMLRPAR